MPTDKPVLTSAEPQLFVADVTAACAFYVGRMGFRIVFTYGEPPYYGQVARDAARLNLRCVDAPVIDPQRREAEQLLSAAITLATRSETEQLAQELRAAGVTFAQDIAVQPWGAINFIVRDPDGNLVLFAGPA